jgi:hypothetical protein
VHFSCHGVKDEDGDLYFAASNTMLRRLGATAVGADFVNWCMGRGRGGHADCHRRTLYSRGAQRRDRRPSMISSALRATCATGVGMMTGGPR